MRRALFLACMTMIIAMAPVHAQRSQGDNKTFKSYHWDNCATPTPSGKVAFSCPAPAR